MAIYCPDALPEGHRFSRTTIMSKLQIYYTDSSYDWNKTVNGTGEGEICVYHLNKQKVRREKLILSFPRLKQLNNRFELAAIALAKKMAGKKHYVIYSDSQVAVGWARDPNVRWISRENNLAGQILDGEEITDKDLKIMKEQIIKRIDDLGI